MRVLVADDDASVRVMLRHLLTTKLKCTVAEARDGLEALEEMSRVTYGLVILDLLMPNLDGLDALAAIRADKRLASTPVVVLSGDRGEETVRRALSLGITDYLTKPFDLSTATDRLRRIIEMR